MEYAIVPIAALLASALTMFSGFGLGTLLMPVLALFLPVELAVVATAVVHGANNVLKATLLGRAADKRVVLRFGIPAVAAALAGAWLLGALSGLAPIAEYSVAGVAARVTPLALVMSLLMVAFAVVDLHPRFAALEFPAELLPIGGVLSGFFGGLSGHQGALRSAFLAKAGISPAAFVGTNAVIGLLVDLTRLSIYAALVREGTLASLLQRREGALVAAAALAAFAGVVLGKRLLGKVTMRSVQRITGAMLLVIAVLLGTGLI